MKVSVIVFVAIFVGGCLSASIFNNEKFKVLKTNLHSRSHAPKKAHEDPKKLSSERKLGTTDYDSENGENNHQGADKGKRCPNRNDMQAAILESTHKNPQKILLARREVQYGMNKKLCNLCKESTKCKKHNKCENCEKYCGPEDVVKEENDSAKAQVSTTNSTDNNDANVSSTHNNVNENNILGTKAPLLQSRFSESENDEFNTLVKVGSLNPTNFLYYGIAEFFKIRQKDVEEFIVFLKPKGESNEKPLPIGRNAQSHDSVGNGYGTLKHHLNSDTFNKNSGESQILHIPVINNFLPESGSQYVNTGEEIPSNTGDNFNIDNFHNDANGKTTEDTNFEGKNLQKNIVGTSERQHIFNPDVNFHAHQLSDFDLNGLHQNIGENGNLQTDFVHHQNNLKTDVPQVQNLHQNIGDEVNNTKIVDTHSSESDESEDTGKNEEHNKSINSKESAESKEAQVNTNSQQPTTNLVPNLPNFNDMNNNIVINQRQSNVNDKNSESNESDGNKDSNESVDSNESHKMVNPPKTNTETTVIPNNTDITATNSFENIISSPNTEIKPELEESIQNHLSDQNKINENKKLVDVFTEIIKNDLKGEENLAEIESENIHKTLLDLVNKTVNQEKKLSDAIHQLNKLEDTEENLSNDSDGDISNKNESSPKTIKKDLQNEDTAGKDTNVLDDSESMEKTDTKINTEGINTTVNDDGQNSLPPNTDGVDKIIHESGGEHNSLPEQVSTGENGNLFAENMGDSKNTPETKFNIKPVIENELNLEPNHNMSVLEENLQKIRVNEPEGNLPPGAIAEKTLLEESGAKEETTKGGFVENVTEESTLKNTHNIVEEPQNESTTPKILIKKKQQSAPKPKFVQNENVNKADAAYMDRKIKIYENTPALKKGENEEIQNSQNGKQFAETNINLNIPTTEEGNTQQTPVEKVHPAETPQSEATTPKIPIKKKLQSPPIAKFVQNEDTNRADAAYMERKIKIYENSPVLNEEGNLHLINSINENEDMQNLQNIANEAPLKPLQQNGDDGQKTPTNNDGVENLQEKLENGNSQNGINERGNIEVNSNSEKGTIANTANGEQLNPPQHIVDEDIASKPQTNNDGVENLQEKLENRNPQNSINEKGNIEFNSNSEKGTIANTASDEQLNPPQQIVDEDIASKPQTNTDGFENLQEKLENRNSQSSINEKGNIEVNSNGEKGTIANIANGEQLNPPQQIVGEDIASKPQTNNDGFENLQEKLENRNSQNNINEKGNIKVDSNSEKGTIANTANGEQLNPPQQIVGEDIASKPQTNTDGFENLQEKLENRNSQNSINEKGNIKVNSNSEKETIANTANGEQLNPPQQIVREDITSKPQQNGDDVEKTSTNNDPNVKPNNEEVGCNLEEKLNPIAEYDIPKTTEKHRLLNDGQINRLIQPLYGMLHAKDNVANRINPNKILQNLKSDMEKTLPYIDDNSNYLHASEQTYLKDTPRTLPDLENRGEFTKPGHLSNLYRSSEGDLNGKSPQNRILGTKVDWAYDGVEEKPTNLNNRLDHFGKLVFANDKSTITNYDNQEMDKQAYFIGNGIKLPLIMKQDKDGSLQLTVDLDKLCNCKEKVCNKNLIEDTSRQRNSDKNNPEELQNRTEEIEDNKNSLAGTIDGEKLEAALEKEMLVDLDDEKTERKRRQLILKPSPIQFSNDIAIGYRTTTNKLHGDAEEDEVVQIKPFKGYKNGHERDNVIVKYTNNSDDEGFVQHRLGLVKKVLSWMKNIAVQGIETDN